MVNKLKKKDTKTDSADTIKKNKATASTKTVTSSKKSTSKKAVPKTSHAKAVSVKQKSKQPGTVADNELNAEKKLKNKLPSKKKKDDIEKIDPDALERGDHPMTVVEHLDEFRTRFLKIFVAFIILVSVAFYFSNEIVYYINKPFLETNNQLHIFKLVGGFMLRLKASAGVAILALIPYLLFQVWRFIVPAIGISERTYSRITVISAVLLFYSGVAFVFFLLIPFTIKMFLSFIGSYMITTIGADDYLSMIFIFCLIMGILFELPIIMLILTKFGIVTPQFLITKRKYAVVIIWIIAAVVTPPDVISQILCGIPLMALYEISIVISRFVIKRKKIKELSES